MTGLFVIGTDTGVGKTTVGIALARLALRHHRPIRPFKPVETGCAPEPLDARALWEAAGCPGSLADVCPFPLPVPAAPAAAAEAAGIHLDLDDLAARGRALAHDGAFLLTEGAGGLLVPYAGALTTADLVARLDLPVLLVARTALGTINHTALTIQELRRRGLPIAGLVMAQVAPSAEPHQRWNVDLIHRLTGLRALGTLPYLTPDHATQPDRLADALERALGPSAVLRLLQLD